MKDILKQLEEFFEKNNPVIIVNTSTNEALLCLSPKFETTRVGLLMKFDSLNERGGNSVNIKSIQGFEENALYLENNEENILMLQALTMNNYKHYIKNQYANAPEFDDENALKNYVLKQKDYAW